MINHIEAVFADAAMAINDFRNRSESMRAIAEAAQIMIHSLKQDGRIFSCGNGGSMSDAMHFAEELSGRYRKDRAALSATAISDPGHISCVANDFGYEEIFRRYLQANARKGDVLLAISTSGKSENVIRAALWAKQNQIQVVSLTGPEGSILGQQADVDIWAGKFDYADRVQELHIKIIHCLIEQIERAFFAENYS